MESRNMKESLLDELEFSQKHPAPWGQTDKLVQHIQNEISILESLRKLGCLKLRDGLEVQEQIESRYGVLRDIQKAQRNPNFS
jgi:hypothetical protein